MGTFHQSKRSDKYMLFTRRKVCIGKTVPEVLDTAQGHSFLNTDRPWLVNNILFFLIPNKWLQKKPPAVSGPDVENTARFRNQSDCRISRTPPAHELRKT